MRRRNRSPSGVTALLAIGTLACGAQADADSANAESGAAAAGDVDVRSASVVTIEYIAHAAFRITSPGGTQLLVDPYESRWWLGYDFPADSRPADAVLLSHPHPDHDGGYAAGRDVPWDPRASVLTDPGVFQFADVRVIGVRGKHADPYGEEFGQKNTIWVIEAGGLRIVHIGDNGPLTEEIAGQLGAVDVLMIPVDDLEHILTHEEVARYRKRLEPRVLVPMHYRHPDLEVDPESPSDLGPIDSWLDRQGDARRLGSHTISITGGELPSRPAVWVFEHHPELTGADRSP